MRSAKPTRRPRAQTSGAPPSAPRRARTSLESHPDAAFPIVGIGGSAGGFEAFERFFSTMPPDMEAAFVVVSHLDPSRKGMLPELLQRRTPLTVLQVKDGVKVLPSTIYVIPPDRDLSIFHRILHVLAPAAPHGVRKPIDVFFTHLAEDQGERAIGIVFSGMGTDGTLGLTAIRAHHGMTLAQEPDSAKFDGMPRSAIAANVVDFVGPPEALVTKLVAWMQHPMQAGLHRGRQSPALQTILMLLRARTGHDCSVYKPSILLRRIQRRMVVHQLRDLAQYASFLHRHPDEGDSLFQELLINVTKFFRDPDGFEAFAKRLLPRIRARVSTDTPFRAWVPACSTGEEAYSIAIVAAECLANLAPRDPVTVQIYATDLDKDAILAARRATYPATIAADVPRERLERFFTRHDTAYWIKKVVRDLVIFAEHDVTTDPPFTRLDLLVCRNLLIYFTTDLQSKLLLLFANALEPGGILFLGPAETVGAYSNLFVAVDSKWNIFERTSAGPPRLGPARIPPSPTALAVPRVSEAGERSDLSLVDLAQRKLLDRFTPPAVVINEHGDIVHVHGRTGKYLEPAPGRATLNLLAMAREGLRLELWRVLQRAVKRGTTVSLKEAAVQTTGNRVVDITVCPIAYRERVEKLALVVFQDHVAPPKQRAGPKRRQKASGTGVIATQFQRVLRNVRRRLQTAVETATAAQAELTSTNEELQATNEELQSTNEELTTSKEEMQSLNEELITVNAEMVVKNDELSRSVDDMRNLLNSTEIACIFLDNQLSIVSFTPHAATVINLIPSDVGRTITHLVANLKDIDLVKQVKHVLDTLAPSEAQVQTTDERWHLMRVMPYRTSENLIEGVIVTFTDISTLKELEQARRRATLQHEALRFAESIVAAVRDPMIVLDSDLRVVFVNRSFCKTFQVTPEETAGQLLHELGNGQWNVPALQHALGRVLPTGTPFDDLTVEHVFPAVGRKVLRLHARQLSQDDERSQLVLLSIEDVAGRPHQQPGPLETP